VQSIVETQDRPSSWLAGPSDVRVDWSFQPVPFQRSASGPVLPSESVLKPTAVQAVGDAHDTPYSADWA
jgi:hypothetical protein